MSPQRICRVWSCPLRAELERSKSENRRLLIENASLSRQLRPSNSAQEENLRWNLRETQAEKERLSSLINSISDEIWFADSNKRFTLANSAGLQALSVGMTDLNDIEEFVSKFEVYRADGTPRPLKDAPALRALNGEFIRNEEECVRIPRTGEWQYRQICASPVKNAEGELTGAVCVVRDITEQKWWEREKKIIAEFLNLLNRSESTRDLIQGTIGFFLKHFEWDEVKIRFAKGGRVSAVKHPARDKRGMSTVNVIPLKQRENPLGYIELHSEKQLRHPESELALCERLVAELSVALSKLQAEEDLKTSHQALGRAEEERTRELLRINTALQRVNRCLLALKKCDDILMRCADESEILEKICKIIRDVGGAKMVWVGLADHDEAQSVRPVASAGDDQNYLVKTKISWGDNPSGCGPTGTAIRSRKLVVCRDIATESIVKPWKKEQLKRGFVSSIALPLIWEDECLGALMIYSPEANAFTPEEVEMLELFAGDLTYGIVTLRTRAEREQLQRELLAISEREKQVISQELHDGLCQNLAGTAMLGSLLSKRLAASNTQSAEAECAKQIAEMLCGNVNEARNLAHGLHPVGPESDGLVKALRQLAQTVNHLFHIQCVFECPEPIQVRDEAASTHLFRIVQEAINNARKHGEADRIVIAFRSGPEGIELSVRDNGRGVPKTLSRKPGLGMRIMKHRAQEIGATLSIHRAGKRGTVVRCVLPDDGTARIG